MLLNLNMNDALGYTMAKPVKKSLRNVGLQ